MPARKPSVPASAGWDFGTVASAGGGQHRMAEFSARLLCLRLRRIPVILRVGEKDSEKSTLRKIPLGRRRPGRRCPLRAPLRGCHARRRCIAVVLRNSTPAPLCSARMGLRRVGSRSDGGSPQVAASRFDFGQYAGSGDRTAEGCHCTRRARRLESASPFLAERAQARRLRGLQRRQLSAQCHG